jgi:hypothetical protein
MNNDWKNNGEIVKHTVDEREIEQLIERIHQLPPQQQMEIGQRLLGGSSGLTVVFGTNNVVANSVSIQIGNTDNIDELLKDVPADALAKLMVAIAHRISQYKN